MRDSVHRSTSPVLPVNNTPQGGRRRLVQSVTLATNTGAFEYTDVTAGCQADLPSCRLHTKLSIGFRPYTSEETPFPQSGALAWTWRLDEWVRNENGLLIPGGNVFTARAIPSSWEAVTLSDQWRAVVTIPNDPGSGIPVDGELFATAIWEPAAGAVIPDDELRALFQACHLRATHAVSVSPGGL